MRLVFVNNVHPDTPHVSGLRVGEFARQMALRGHQVVLLCGAREESGGTAIPQIELLVAQHGWREPLIIEVPLRPRRMLDLVRRSVLPRVLRRPLTAWYFARYGGSFPDWSEPAKEYAREVIRYFRPDLAWGTFGNTSNLIVAQFTARVAGCHWILDVKDNWSAFLKGALGPLMARKFRDAAGQTNNCVQYERISRRWLRQGPSRVVYSGVSDHFFLPVAASSATPSEILLIGSARSVESLKGFLSGVREWVSQLPMSSQQAVRFVYAGADGERVRRVLEATQLPCPFQVLDYLPTHQLARHCKTALVNCYIWMPLGFHHKLLELLVCGRPIISFGGETEEAIGLASKVATPFSICAHQGQVVAALEQAWKARADSIRRDDSPCWSWRSLAVELESFFRDIVESHK